MNKSEIEQSIQLLLDHVEEFEREKDEDDGDVFLRHLIPYLYLNDKVEMTENQLFWLLQDAQLIGHMGELWKSKKNKVSAGCVQRICEILDVEGGSNKDSKLSIICKEMEIYAHTIVENYRGIGGIRAQDVYGPTTIRTSRSSVPPSRSPLLSPLPSPSPPPLPLRLFHTACKCGAYIILFALVSVAVLAGVLYVTAPSTTNVPNPFLPLCSTPPILSSALCRLLYAAWYEKTNSAIELAAFNHARLHPASASPLSSLSFLHPPTSSPLLLHLITTGPSPYTNIHSRVENIIQSIAHSLQLEVIRYPADRNGSPSASFHSLQHHLSSHPLDPLCAVSTPLPPRCLSPMQLLGGIIVYVEDVGGLSRAYAEQLHYILDESDSPHKNLAIILHTHIKSNRRGGAAGGGGGEERGGEEEEEMRGGYGGLVNVVRRELSVWRNEGDQPDDVLEPLLNRVVKNVYWVNGQQAEAEHGEL